MAGISNHYDTMTAIKNVIDALDLDELAGGTVIQEVADYRDNTQTLPFVSISPYGPETVDDELNDQDGVGYGVLISIIAKPSVNSLETRLGWRQLMRRHLNNAAIPSLQQNYNLQVEPGNVIDPDAWFDRKAFVSAFVVRAYFQEPRT